ncbi:MAG: type II toxin-antitoxin system VapC family toxin [Planctomycetes bacterium]|nr:type II toxin-antitoxin system VapC family toxin [Planctomycetota bacterium]
MRADLEFPETSLARAVHEQDPEWGPPGISPHEFANALGSLIRMKRADRNSVLMVWDAAASLFERGVQEVPLPKALDLAAAQGVTATDAEFIVLAQTLGVPCVTEDRQLCDAFPKIAISMRVFLDA